ILEAYVYKSPEFKNGIQIYHPLRNVPVFLRLVITSLAEKYVAHACFSISLTDINHHNKKSLTIIII
ncbi:hypothetical protein, partial [[Clostridium] innocuum]|uniref:hypothetical protein n=1 Tax=Clostridium innocuum TaxID=1522 RepID=UPI0022E03E37